MTPVQQLAMFDTTPKMEIAPVSPRADRPQRRDMRRHQPVAELPPLPAPVKARIETKLSPLVIGNSEQLLRVERARLVDAYALADLQCKQAEAAKKLAREAVQNHVAAALAKDGEIVTKIKSATFQLAITATHATRLDTTKIKSTMPQVWIDDHSLSSTSVTFKVTDIS